MVFDSLVLIQVGEGSCVLFWRDRWIRNVAVKSFAPMVYAAVRKQCRNRRTVKEVLSNHRWIHDINGELSS
jgi:hypothetical protein